MVGARNAPQAPLRENSTGGRRDSHPHNAQRDVPALETASNAV